MDTVVAMKSKIILYAGLSSALLYFAFFYPAPLMAKEAVVDAKIDQDILKEISLEGLLELPFIEIATGTAVPIEKAPSVASLITAEDIKAMGALTLEEVIESIPGIHVSPSTLTSETNFSIRGIKTSLTPQVLILYNGYRISSDVYTATLPYGAKINLRDISRIEILRGPGSAVYGADAYSGVINIISKSAKEINGLHAGLQTGSYDAKSFWAQYGNSIGSSGWDITASIGYSEQSADQSRILNSDAQTLLDGLFGTSASLAPSYFDDRYETTNFNIHLSNSNWKYGFDYWSQNDVGFGFGIAQAIDHKGSQENDQYLLSAEYTDTIWQDALKFTGKFSYQETQLQSFVSIFPAGTAVLIGDDGNLFTSGGGLVTFTDGIIGNPGRKSKTPKLDLTFLYTRINDHQLRFNMGIKKEQLEANEAKNFGPGILDLATVGSLPSTVDGTLTDVTNTGNIYVSNEKRTIKYISIQDVWDINIDWILTTGIRYDYYSVENRPNIGGVTNPRLALVWTTTDKLTSKLLYGSAFRAPTFSELYNQNNPVALGHDREGNTNPEELRPETVTTIELAFSYQASSNIIADLNLYQYKTKDMISISNNGNGEVQANNLNSLTGKGIEIEVHWKINKQWNVTSNYANQSTKDDVTNIQSPFIPKQQLFVDARWRFFRNWIASTQLNWIGDREREQTDTRAAIDDYTLVNLTVRRKNIRITDAKINWEITASVKNLFDADIRAPTATSNLGPPFPNDIPLNERRWYLEIRSEF